MTEVFQGSDLDEIIEEMFAHMKTNDDSIVDVALRMVLIQFLSSSLRLDYKQESGNQPKE